MIKLILIILVIIIIIFYLLDRNSKNKIEFFGGVPFDGDCSDTSDCRPAYVCRITKISDKKVKKCLEP